MWKSQHLANITASPTESNITGNYALLFALICVLVQQASTPLQHIPQLTFTQTINAEGVTLIIAISDMNTTLTPLLKQAEALIGEIASTMRGSFSIRDETTAYLTATFFPEA